MSANEIYETIEPGIRKITNTVTGSIRYKFSTEIGDGIEFKGKKYTKTGKTINFINPSLEKVKEFKAAYQEVYPRAGVAVGTSRPKLASKFKDVPGESNIKVSTSPAGNKYMVQVMRDRKQINLTKGNHPTTLEAAKKIRDTFIAANPYDQAAMNRQIHLGKGDIDMKEANKAARFFYKRGEVAHPVYADLDNIQKRKIWSNVMRGAAPGKFSKINQFTPLLKSQQNKILKYFPDADFDAWKYGFDVNDKSSWKNFRAVRDFVNRGYRPAFSHVDALPKKVQNVVIEAFGKEAAEARTPLRFGPGRKFGLTVKENPELGRRISNFVGIGMAGKDFPYAFNWVDKPANWIITQMVRAANNNNPAYKILKNKAGKIVGASENGVKWYHMNSMIGKIINTHPEAPAISKMVDIAAKAKANIPTALEKMFPKGFDRNVLGRGRAYTDLLQWLDNSEGRRSVKNAIELHHAGEGAATGSPALARDLQLLRRQDNMLAHVIKTQILKDDFSRVSELKEKGIRLNVGGKEYGAGFETAEAGMSRIEKQASTELAERLKIDPKLQGFSKFLRQDLVGKAGSLKKLFMQEGAGGGEICNLVSRKAAGGGRIAFANGSNCAIEIGEAFDRDPIRTTEQVSRLERATGKVKQAATGFLNFAKKGGKFGALAAVGAAGAGLVKTFMNDDPTTYLSDENQQKNMLIEMVTGPIDETPKESPEILDWQLPTLGAVTAAGMVPGGKRLYDVRRRGGVFPTAQGTKVLKPANPVRAALGLKGVLGKGLAATATPLGLAALEPLHIAGQVAQGDSLTDIATNPWNYLGPTFASGLTKEATRFTSPMVSKIMRMGMSPTALRGLSRFGGYGLAASLGIQGLQKFGDWRNKRGWFREE